jgi:FkbM family methyltransferase
MRSNRTPRRALLRDSIARNADYRAEIRTDYIDIVISGTPGRCQIVPGQKDNQGATSVRSADASDIDVLRCLPLDDLAFDGDITLLKIDTEGMELEVLAGAAKPIVTHRPSIAVEVMDRNYNEFWGWVDQSASHVIQAFRPYLGCWGYVLVPRVDTRTSSSDGSRIASAMR